MIHGARSFLYLSTFYIEHDAYGIELISALQQAAERGVEVNLLIDGYGQRLGGAQMSRKQRGTLSRCLDALTDAGAVVQTYQPRHRLQRWLGGGQHVKMQVSEEGEAIFGSSNITKASFEGWNEYAVALRGPVVRTLLESYRDIGGTVATEHLGRLHAKGAHADIPLDYWFENPNLRHGRLGPIGWQGPNEVTARLVEMVASAQREVLISSFYFKPCDALARALLDAARRGVHIEIHHSHRDALPATDLAWVAAAVSYAPLLDAGVEIYEGLHGEHSKVVLVDGNWAAFGSYNFEDAAHDRLAEAMLASRDPRAVEPARAMFEVLRAQTDNLLVTAASFRRLPAPLKARVARYGRFKWWL